MLRAACFNTQPPEGGWDTVIVRAPEVLVSTHSRPKAAGPAAVQTPPNTNGFNTQPPEGGWRPKSVMLDPGSAFQHTAARRRLGGKGF